MYAVVLTGGKQYKVAVNDVLRVEMLPGAKGDTVELTEVLAISGDEPGALKIGEAIAGSKVIGTVLHQGRDTKVLVFKKRRRKNYRRKFGHRQSFTELRITAIQ